MSIPARRTCALLSAALLALTPALAQSPPPLEQQVKAALLVKFPLFIDWPPEAFASAVSPIVIGLLGRHGFGEEFERELARQQIKGRSLRLKPLRDLDELKGCHMVFIAPEADDRLPQVLARLGGAPVLVVGDSAGFAERGGMINFIKKERKVRFQLNLEAARQVGLRVSARLLEVSEVVKPARLSPGQ